MSTSLKPNAENIIFFNKCDICSFDSFSFTTRSFSKYSIISVANFLYDLIGTGKSP